MAANIANNNTNIIREVLLNLFIRGTENMQEAAMEDIVGERYQKIELLQRRGGFASYYLCKDLQNNGQIVLVKKIKTDAWSYEAEGQTYTSMRELSALRELKHANIINLLNHINEGMNSYLVFEYIEKNITAYLKSFTPSLTIPHCSDKEQCLKKLMFQLTKVVNFLHSNRYLHRDLKPNHLMIDTNGDLKLTGFDISRVIGIPVRAYTHEVVTLWYRAPEILLGATHYSTPIDIWSIGCIIAELASDCHPIFPGDSEIDQMYKIFRLLGTPDEDNWLGVTELRGFLTSFPKWPSKPLREASITIYPSVEYQDIGMAVSVPLSSLMSPLLINLLQQILVYTPAHRITARQAMFHPYFRDVWDSVMHDTYQH